MSPNKPIVVIGSINMDMVIGVERHPGPGETVSGRGPAYYPGGKGANQAVAAARAGGASVRMLGAVGTDAYGDKLIAELADAGVDSSLVKRLEGPTGMAFITVDEQAENIIVVCPNANGSWTSADMDTQKDSIEGAAAIVLQNEIPWEATRRAMEIASAVGVPVVMNPAPVFDLPPDAYALIGVLVVNEYEAAQLSGIQVTDRASAERAGRALAKRGAARVVVTLGGSGVVAVEREGGEAAYTPSFKVDVVDTTAAGDTFIGGLTARWLEGASFEEAIRFGSAAAAIAVSRAGAQTSVPTRAEVDRLLASAAGGGL